MTFQTGQRVRLVSKFEDGGFGCAPDPALPYEFDTTVPSGTFGEIIAEVPGGWLLVQCDEGVVPVAPDMIEAVS